jgi:hypothetical protein
MVKTAKIAVNKIPMLSLFCFEDLTYVHINIYFRTLKTYDAQI